MAHTHPENEGGYLKHVVLQDTLEQLSRQEGFTHIHYIDPYCGQGLFRRPNHLRHSPTTPAAKVQVWRDQQTNPDYYLGSPLIALRILQQSGLGFSLRLSDKEDETVAQLHSALQGDITGYEPGKLPDDFVVQQTTYTGNGLELLLAPAPSAVNFVLLDPTHPNKKGEASYIETIDNSVEACGVAKPNAVLMCPRMQNWRWPARFSNMATALAAYTRSVVHLLCFGPSSEKLAAGVRAAVRGW